MDKKIIKVEGEYIKLQDLLKYSGLCQTGGHAKVVIQNGEVKVNGEVYEMRGKKLRTGDIAEYNNEQVEVIMV
ncbi:MAG: RNA-binding S4 domain-containing protein [Ruminococcus sp.]|nr:RNA-binding S4 domain-containing protein [Ruminococcus sp.]